MYNKDEDGIPPKLNRPLWLEIVQAIQTPQSNYLLLILYKETQ